MDYSYFRLCFISCLIYIVNGQDPPCTGRDQCSCATDDGKVIDLSSIGKTDGTPAFPDIQAPDGYLYSYNPCYPFTELACADQSVCQIPADKSTSYPAGDASSAVFNNDGLNNHVVYTSTDSAGTTRSTDVTLVCDQTGSPPAMTALGEQGSSVYLLTLSTKCACPDGCVQAPPTDPSPTTKKPKIHVDIEVDGISIGTILCICVLAVAVVYLVGGILFMKLQRQATGKELIPNSSFWGSVPGNIKNGFKYTYCKIRRQEFSNQYSSI